MFCVTRARILPASNAWSLVAVALVSATFSMTAFAAATAGEQPTSSAYVYVGTSAYIGSGAPLDRIFGYAVAQDGSAEPVPSSPFTGPSWSVVGGGSHVFATDQTNIATYTAAANGSLTETSSVNGIAHDPDRHTASVQSLSLPSDGRNLYTDNWFFDGANNDYESWTVAADGSLTYLNNPGQPLYSTAGGWPLTFTSDGRFAYTWSVCKWDGSVWGLARTNGRLTYFNSGAQGLWFNAGSSSECSQGVATSALGYVAAAWNGGYCCGGPEGIATYTIADNGTLKEVSQVITIENVMAFDPTGRYLAVAVSGGVQIYQLQPNGSLTPIGSPQEATVPFSNFAWDNANHLYAITDENSQFCQNNNSACGLYIFNSNEGMLSLAPGSPYTIPGAGSLAVLPPQQ